MIELSKKVVKNFEEKKQETTGIKDFFNKLNNIYLKNFVN